MPSRLDPRARVGQAVRSGIGSLHAYAFLWLLLVSLSPAGAAPGGRSAEALTRALEALAARPADDDPGVAAVQLEQLLAAAEERRALLAELTETDPEAVLENALSAERLAGLPRGIQAKLEREVELEGELEVVVEDGEGWSRTRHVLKDASGKRRSLHFAEQAPELLTGDRVRVRGVEVPLEAGAEGAVVAYCCGGDPGVEVLAAAELPDTFGEQRTVVLLVRFQNSTVEGWTPEEAGQIFFGDLSNFFREVSYGASWLGGDVFGTYTLSIDEVCNIWLIADAARATAAANGIDLSRYRRIVYASPKTSCNLSGTGTIGGNPSQAWINGRAKVGILGHEIGHNFGLYHSHSLECGSTSLGSNCTRGEYGDLADAMGSNRGHLNPFQKQRLGWLTSGDVIVVASDGIYPLEAYETPKGGLPKALKIPKGVDPATGLPSYYHVEYRQPIGLDAFLTAWDSIGGNLTSGVLVRIATDGDPDSSLLLDARPQSDVPDDWGDAAVAFGSSYTDSESGMTISAQSGDGTSATVVVSFGSEGCAAAAPGVSVAPALGPAVSPGTPVAFAVTVTNRDSESCAPARFDLSAIAPVGWSARLGAVSLSIAPGATASSSLDVTSPTGASDGSYRVEARAAHPGGTGNATASYQVSSASTQNQPPIAVDDSAATAVDTSVTIAVLLNDSDPDQDLLSVASASPPSRGQVRVNADGTLTYTPASGFRGTDSFSYIASDGSATDSAQVVVSVGVKARGNGKGPRK